MHLHLPTTASTMDAARQRLASGDTTTTLITTSEQTSGRGRQGATWHTFPAPFGLACTLIVRSPQPLPHLALITSLAVFNALKTLAPSATQALAIKWPNDLLLAEKKLAGLLIETVPNPANPAQTTYLIGLGLNVSAPPQVPASFPGTFLFADETPEITPNIIALQVQACLLQLLPLYSTQGWAPLHNSYLSACTTLGRRARWKRAGEHDLTGIARGLTKDGHLELEADDGQTHIISSGLILEETSQ